MPDSESLNGSVAIYYSAMGEREKAQAALQRALAGKQRGTPVMIKAAAGGGGKGMQLVRRPEQVAEALRAG